jgi:hypothetical protein
VSGVALSYDPDNEVGCAIVEVVNFGTNVVEVFKIGVKNRQD